MADNQVSGLDPRSPDAVAHGVQIGTGPGVIPQQWLDNFPEEWTRSNSPVKAVWIAAYSINEVRQADLSPPIDLLVAGTEVILDFTTVAYLNASDIRIEIDSSGATPVGSPDIARVTDSPTLLILVPVEDDPHGNRFDPGPCEERVEAIVGLLTVTLGRSAAYSRIFENMVVLDDRSLCAFRDDFENPLWHGPPDLSDEALERLLLAGDALDALGPNERRRTHLALRWLAQARDARGVDAFIRLWLALETLAMPDTSNIKPLEEALGDAYEIDLAPARTRFRMGRVYELRNRVLHDGEQFEAPASLLFYMRAVFADLLSNILGLPNVSRAQQALEGPHASGLFEHFGWA